MYKVANTYMQCKVDQIMKAQKTRKEKRDAKKEFWGRKKKQEIWKTQVRMLVEKQEWVMKV